MGRGKKIVVKHDIPCHANLEEIRNLDSHFRFRIPLYRR